MKIEKIRARSISVPLNQPFRTSLSNITSKDHIVVEITTDEGICGVGEIGPLPEFSGESGESGRTVVDRLLAPAIIGQDAFEIESLMENLDLAVKGNNLAKSAVDFALHDIVGKALSVPACQLLGGFYRDSIRLAWAMGMKEPKKMADEALNAVREGYTTLKLKVGTDPGKDLERIRAVREAVGPDIGIRADANQGYSPAIAIKVIRKFEVFDLQYVEQPLPYWDLDGMARVAEAIETPIMADESVFSIHDVVKIVRKRAADIINLKVGKVGGLRASRKIALIAESAGIPCMVGSMLELWIGTLAGVHLATAMKNVSYESELIGPRHYQYDIIKEEPKISNGTIEVPRRPGLGAELDERKIHGENL